MNVTDVEVLHAQVAQKMTSSAQLLQLEANIDLSAQDMTIHWYNVSEGGICSADSFASATVRFEDLAAWQIEWDRVTHLVTGRIEALSRMATDGTANKLSKNMTYNLFKNVVDYADKYRGMQTVVLNEYEAYADITLVPESHGTWHTPPHWIDSIFHLAGLIMNGSDASNTKDFFYVTPGWSNCRMVKLKPGAGYRSYVKMFPTKEANMYCGDVYVMQDDVIVGMMGDMKFRKVPRLLMDQFFSPPDMKKKSSTGEAACKVIGPTSSPTLSVSKESLAPKSLAVPLKSNAEVSEERSPESAPATTESAFKDAAGAPVIEEANSVTADCLKLIARETGLETDELTDDASFVELGVDSLTSLVLAEKFRSELQLEVKSSLFIECQSIAELKGWLEQYS